MQPKIQQIVKQKIKLPTHFKVKFLNISVDDSKPKDHFLSPISQSKNQTKTSQEEMKNKIDSWNYERVKNNFQDHINNINYIYDDKLNDERGRYSQKWQISNIEKELINHRIKIEQKFTNSKINQKYSFPRRDHIFWKHFSEVNKENLINICIFYNSFNGSSKY